METQTAIPKTHSPANYNELRNISCTNFLSKILESFVLERLQNEIELKYSQFGGVRGTGSSHLLIDTYQRVIDCLEQGKTAVSLISIDFSKAFNRMCHYKCINELARQGASTETIGMIGAFLTGRQMTVKVNSVKSAPRLVRGGSPQGTKLGNVLFAIVIEAIEEENHFLTREIPPSITYPLPQAIHERGTPRKRKRRLATTNPDNFDASEFGMASTPVRGATADGVLRYHDVSGRGYESEEYEFDLLLNEQPPPEWKRIPPWTIKYVDDLNAGQTHYLPSATSIFTTGRQTREIRADDCERIFDIVKRNAAEIGMRVNDAKTQLVCISPEAEAVRSFVQAGEETIMSGNAVKILGFMVGCNGGMHAHVEYIKKKFGKRIWTIIHLKRANLSVDTLSKVYAATIRSVILYAAQVYHCMLTEDLSEKLERLQRLAMRIIHPPGTSYRDALTLSNLPRLSDMRTEMCKKFAKKTQLNPRYEHWFPKNPPNEHNLRHTLTYKEETARTERRRKSPVFYMRRVLNGL